MFLQPDVFTSFPAHRLPHEPVPVQAVLVDAVGRVYIGADVKRPKRVDDDALLGKGAYRQVLFKRARAAPVDPHAALGRSGRFR